MADVQPIRAGLGPPATDFEREAVETLLANIRNFRAEHGEPEVALYILVNPIATRGVATRVGWFNLGKTPLRLIQAWAAAILTEKAVEQ